VRRNALRFEHFGPAHLRDEFDAGSKQVEYLAKYLAHPSLSARSMVIEGHYVDRHFLDDFARYYARSFNAPEPFCSRVHFFSLKKDEVSARLGEALESETPAAREAAAQKLRASYLGFAVRRPLPGARLGRTVLKTYPIQKRGRLRRHYTVIRPYRVNLIGVDLFIDGLAFQQQDGGAAVCASTALWSALQRVAPVAGHRTPTPSEVTAAADSPFPASHGLGDFGCATALANLGYAAELYRPENDPVRFRAKVVACLRSRLPVVLTIEQRGEEHAVTLTGFREPEEIVDVAAASGRSETFRTRSGSVSTFYVHDDNLGPHAHYELFDVVGETKKGNVTTLRLRRAKSDEQDDAEDTSPSAADAAPPASQASRELDDTIANADEDDPISWEEWLIDDPEWDLEWDVASALVPKPLKLRFDVDTLFENLIWLAENIETQLFEGRKVHYETRFDSGVDYRKSIVGRKLDRARLREFMEMLSLPRHIGVISVHDDASTECICDFLIDVSEHDRKKGIPAVLGIVAHGVPFFSSGRRNLVEFCDEFGGWLFITAPEPSPPVDAPAPP
jgi:hypothetical protein